MHLNPAQAFLAKAVVISLSGVMAPGPISAATLAAGLRRPHAGAALAIGHGIIEFPLMALLIGGLGAVLQGARVQAGIGIAGGLVLIVLGLMLLPAILRPSSSTAPVRVANPLWTGAALSATNPYFLLWWATVGLAMLTEAATFGLAILVAFAILHWLCDLVWLEVLSFTSFKGIRALGQGVQRAIMATCLAVMVFFGASFVIASVRKLL